MFQCVPVDFVVVIEWTENVETLTAAATEARRSLAVLNSQFPKLSVF
jgi:hypothetical protein